MTDIVTQPKKPFDIREKIYAWATEDELIFDPLAHDADVFKNRPTEEVAGYSIPLVNSLTSGEDWFFKKLESSQLESLIGARGAFGRLNMKAKEVLGLKEDQTIWDVVTGGQSGLLAFANGREGDFILENEEEIKQFLRAWTALTNSSYSRIARIWFALVGRCNVDIEPVRVAQGMLVNDQEKFLSILVREMNGGVEPGPAPVDAPVANEGNGQTPPSAPGSGEKSTGNLTATPTSETNALEPEDLVLSHAG